MKRMKKIGLSLIVSLLVCIAGIGVANAAVFKADIADVTGKGVYNFASWFSVGDDFQLMSFITGNAIPVDQSQWQMVKGPVENNSVVDDSTYGLVYKVDGFDFASLLDLGHNPLVDGTLFEFEYSGTLFGLTNVLKMEGGNEDLFASGEFSVLSYDSEGMTIGSPVPIPGGLILFGSGLLGFFGIKRRKE